MKYTGIIYTEENGFWIEFPDIEGCHTQVDTMEELMENAKEALKLCLEEMDHKPQSRKIKLA